MFVPEKSGFFAVKSYYKISQSVVYIPSLGEVFGEVFVQVQWVHHREHIVPFLINIIFYYLSKKKDSYTG